jgi:hypothetical protein
MGQKGLSDPIGWESELSAEESSLATNYVSTRETEKGGDNGVPGQDMELVFTFINEHGVVIERCCQGIEGGVESCSIPMFRRSLVLLRFCSSACRCQISGAVKIVASLSVTFPQSNRFMSSRLFLVSLRKPGLNVHMGAARLA